MTEMTMIVNGGYMTGGVVAYVTQNGSIFYKGRGQHSRKQKGLFGSCDQSLATFGHTSDAITLCYSARRFSHAAQSLFKLKDDANIVFFLRNTVNKVYAC